MKIHLTIGLLLTLALRYNGMATDHSKLPVARDELSVQRLTLIFSQPKYTAGDTMYFKAYYLKPDLSKVPGKVVANVQLINPKGQMISLIKFNVLNGIGSNQILLPDTCEAGSYTVVAYTNHMKNFDPPPIFYKDILIADNLLEQTLPESGQDETKNSSNANLNVSKSVFEPGEKVTVDFRYVSVNGLPDKAEFSVKVLQDKFFRRAEAKDINGVKAGFADYTGTKVFENITIPDDQLVVKQGYAHFKGTDLPLPEGVGVMIYLQHSKIRYQAIVKKDGYLKFQMLDQYYPDELFYAANINDKNFIDFEIIWLEDDVPTNKAGSPFIQSAEGRDPYVAFTARKRIIDKAYNIYSESSDLKITSKSFEDIIQGADVNLDVTKYVSFDSMGELIREVIPQALYFGEKRDKQIIRVKYLKPRPAREDPLFIIDGIATYDTEFFLSLNPSECAEIKVVRNAIKLKRFGPMAKNGIVILKTLKGGVRPNPPRKEDIIFGMSQPIEFNDGPFSNESPRFQATVYWNPSILTNDEGEATFEFYLSDDLGNHTMIVEGLSDKGEVFYIQQSIKSELRKAN